MAFPVRLWLETQGTGLEDVVVVHIHCSKLSTRVGCLMLYMALCTLRSFDKSSRSIRMGDNPYSLSRYLNNVQKAT